MQLRSLVLAVLASASFAAHADIVALWSYTDQSPNQPVSTKQTQSANGASFAALGAGKTSTDFVTTTFVGGVTSSGTDKALNTTGYAAQNTNSGVYGVQYNVDTTGYIDLVLTFDQRNSNTASAWTALQYTVDGNNWTWATNFQMPAAQSAKFIPGGFMYDFSNIDAVDNNPLFGVRLVAIFAPNSTSYLATGTGSSYGTAGTIRYDNVKFSGDAMPDLPPDVPAVPEPQTYALMLAGLAGVAAIARRRRA